MGERPRARVVAMGTEANRKRVAARSKPTIGAILAPTDFSPESRRALDYASLLLKMRKLAAKIDFGGVPHRTEIQVGRPAEQICQYADDRGIDLIIASTHGHTGWAHVLIGSVAEHVVRYAHCPVLVVPHGKGPATRRGRARGN